jgi:hypothetical protein
MRSNHGKLTAQGVLFLPFPVFTFGRTAAGVSSPNLYELSGYDDIDAASRPTGKPARNIFEKSGPRVSVCRVKFALPS